MDSRRLSYVLAGSGLAIVIAAAAACDMAAAVLYVEDGGSPYDGEVVGGDGSYPAGDTGGKADTGTGNDTGAKNDAGGGCNCPDGCCDGQDKCLDGKTSGACGKNGDRCADCTGDGKTCVDQACAAPTGCKVSSDCPLGNICATDTCVPGCNKDLDCPDAAKKCDTAAKPHGKCVECIADADCKALGATYVCNAGVCEKGIPVCKPACMAWETCDENQQCTVKSGYCGSDGDCTPPDTCDLATHKCMKPECTADADCGDTAICPVGCGGTCAGGKCQCISMCGNPLCGTCTGDADCQPGLSCSGLTTKKCNTSCSTDADCGGIHCYTWIKSCQCP